MYYIQVSLIYTYDNDLCWCETWKTSEGSIPSIGLGRDIRGLLTF